ncbi:MAG TPA: M48 family metalloprotease [Fimbriimonas sp.]|nr:M48 family metalloprotease [Fimbriimonas sp.]
MKQLFGLGIFVLAAGANAQMFKPSKNDQLKAGQEYAAKLRKEEKVLPNNDPRVILIRDIGRRLLATRTPREISREPWQFTFDVIDSKEVNAFALPGGPVFFYTGLINKVTTVDELAGIMGHELIHVRREHWASAVNAQQERSAGIMILGSIFGASRQTVDIAQIVTQYGMNLPASRGQEKESDEHGFDMMLKAGYNPEGMVRVFQMFRDLKGSGGSVEFLSTHPDDKARISKLQNKITDYKKKGKITTLPPLKPLPFETDAMRAKPKTGTSRSR